MASFLPMFLLQEINNNKKHRTKTARITAGWQSAIDRFLFPEHCENTSVKDVTSASEFLHVHLSCHRVKVYINAHSYFRLTQAILYNQVKWGHQICNWTTDIVHESASYNYDKRPKYTNTPERFKIWSWIEIRHML